MEVKPVSKTLDDLYALQESAARQQGWLPDNELLARRREEVLSERHGQRRQLLNTHQRRIADGLIAAEEAAAAEVARKAVEVAEAEHRQRQVDAFRNRALTTKHNAEESERAFRHQERIAEADAQKAVAASLAAVEDLDEAAVGRMIDEEAARQKYGPADQGGGSPTALQQVAAHALKVV